ncbi:hypothetical protein BV898_14094 [Hypsibius exemplaris]|uniref:Uncharacterized protein n=1 Tax=Hypsibius exemplaris TaxID=2072580 RepID=A0A1W0W8R8_HYPEX|nr:hypothetical protein BV898_14094 [Hypsibius exemplaris]
MCYNFDNCAFTEPPRRYPPPTAPPSTNYDSGSGCMTTNDAGMICRTCTDGMTATRRCQSGWVSEDPLPSYNGYTYGNVDQLGQLVPYQRRVVQPSGYQQQYVYQ